MGKRLKKQDCPSGKDSSEASLIPWRQTPEQVSFSNICMETSNRAMTDSTCPPKSCNNLLGRPNHVALPRSKQEQHRRARKRQDGRRTGEDPGRGDRAPASSRPLATRRSKWCNVATMTILNGPRPNAWSTNEHNLSNPSIGNMQKTTQNDESDHHLPQETHQTVRRTRAHGDRRQRFSEERPTRTEKSSGLWA